MHCFTRAGLSTHACEPPSRMMRAVNTTMVSLVGDVLPALRRKIVSIMDVMLTSMDDVVIMLPKVAGAGARSGMRGHASCSPIAPRLMWYAMLNGVVGTLFLQPGHLTLRLSTFSVVASLPRLCSVLAATIERFP